VGGKPYVRRCDIQNSSKIPAVGIIYQKTGPSTCLVKTQGLVPISFSLSPGARYFVGSGGQPTNVVPSLSAPFWYIQYVGMATSTSQLLCELSSPTKRVTD